MGHCKTMYIVIHIKALLYISIAGCTRPDQAGTILNHVQIIHFFFFIINTGDGHPSDSAEIYYPSGITFDNCGNMYFCQVEIPRIRKVSFNPYCWPQEVNEVPENQIHIYPNPTTEILNIDKVKTKINYELFNITGIIELSGKLKEGSNTISIKDLSLGLYLLELITDTGEKTIRKIIKN